MLLQIFRGTASLLFPLQNITWLYLSDSGCHSFITQKSLKVLLPVEDVDEVPPVWWTPTPVAGMSQPSVDRRPAEQLYIPAALSAGKQRTAASRTVAPGVLLGPLRVPLHALITVQTEPIPVYPTCPKRQALSLFDHEAQ